MSARQGQIVSGLVAYGFGVGSTFVSAGWDVLLVGIGLLAAFACGACCEAQDQNTRRTS